MTKLVDLFIQGSPLLLSNITSITTNDKFIANTLDIKEIWIPRLSSFDEGDKGFEKTLKRLSAWHGEYTMIIMLEDNEGIHIVFTTPAIDYIIGVIYTLRKIGQHF